MSDEPKFWTERCRICGELVPRWAAVKTDDPGPLRWAHARCDRVARDVLETGTR